MIYRMSQNSRIPNSERGRKGPSGVRKILRKKFSLFLKKIQGVPKIIYFFVGDIFSYFFMYI
jgi:hypothetical protein